MEKPRVLIVMGSRSDMPAMEGCMAMLDDLNVGYEVRVLSAHRTPEAVLELSRTAKIAGSRSLLPRPEERLIWPASWPARHHCR